MVISISLSSHKHCVIEHQNGGEFGEVAKVSLIDKRYNNNATIVFQPPYEWSDFILIIPELCQEITYVMTRKIHDTLPQAYQRNFRLPKRLVSGGPSFKRTNDHYFIIDENKIDIITRKIIIIDVLSPAPTPTETSIISFSFLEFWNLIHRLPAINQEIEYAHLLF